MNDAHRRYLIVEQGIGAAAFNLLLNGGIAWLMFRSLETVPLWGDRSIAADTLGTLFFLPFFTCLVVTGLTHRQLRRGKLQPVAWRRDAHPALRRLPRATLARSLVLGAGAVAVVGPVAVASLGALGVEGMGFWTFVAFKAGVAAGLAVLFTPLIALCALGDGSPAGEAAP